MYIRLTGICGYKLSAITWLFCLFLCGCHTSRPNTTFETSGYFSHVTDLPISKLSGAQTTLSEHKHKIVMLHFWATWCVLCKHELGDFEKLARRVDKSNFKIIALSLDQSIEKVRACPEVRPGKVEYLVDTSGVIPENISGFELPATYLLNETGDLLDFPDPNGSGLTNKVFGPRNWLNKELILRLQDLAA